VNIIVVYVHVCNARERDCSSVPVSNSFGCVHELYSAQLNKATAQNSISQS